MLQSTTNPVVITVTLKDAFDFPVTNQPQCLKINPSNPKDSFYNVKLKKVSVVSTTFPIIPKRETITV